MKPKLVPGSRAIALPDTKAVRRVFPQAKTVPKYKGKAVFVRHGVPETRLLRRLGAKIPCPMEKHYPWKRPPWEAQQITSSMLVMYRRGYVLNDMGTGKTYSALAGADFLMQEREVRSALIVAPVSTLVETWRNEILRWFPHRSCAILHASAAARRKELLAMPNDFYIVNHHGVEVLHEELAARPDIDLIILDELSIYRNGRAGRDADGKIRHRLYYYAKQLVKGRKYVWGMTGAVCPNAPTDAWAQAQLITPNRITPWWTEFRDKTMIRIDQHLWVDKDNAMDTVYNTLQPSVRFKLEDCQDLPPVVLETRDVPMSKHQQKAYSDIMLSLNRNIVISNSSGKPEYVDSVNEAVQINKLLQIACGWIYGDKHQNIDLAPAGRLNELLAVINEAPAKVIVFAPFKNAIEEMAKFLQKKKVDCAMIHSGVSRPARDKIFSAFQHTPKYRVIVAQPGTMSHGLTLTAASIIVWYAPIHSLDTYIQANRRITRPGQQHGQVIIHLKGSPVEARIYSKLQKQERKLNILLDLFESNPTTGEHYGRSGISAAA